MLLSNNNADADWGHNIFIKNFKKFCLGIKKALHLHSLNESGYCKDSWLRIGKEIGIGKFIEKY